MSSFRSAASSAATAPLPSLYSKTQLKGVKGLDNDSDNDTHSPSPADIDTPTSLASKRTSADEFDSDALAEDDCKYDDEELLKTKTPLLTGNDPTAKREEIRAYFHKTYSLYEKLFDVLATDQTFFMQPEKLRHPLMFYFAHTSVFFINKLRLAGLLTQRINEHMESTCAIGVDEMSWDDLRPSNYVWPSVDEARKYRDMARLVVDDLISSLPLQLPITWDSPFWVILMGCEHERIHLETSSVLFRQLPIEQVKPVPMWESCKQFRSRPTEVPQNKLLPVPGGKVVTGKSLDNGDTYGWDSEYGHFETTTEPIQASQFLCSNAEFYEFVQDGGYEDPSLWGEEGARFIQFRKATCPVFWVPIESEPTADGKPQVTYKYRTMTRVIDMPWDWPVDCNYIEAKAFCAWKNRQRTAAGIAEDGLTVRLPSEAEYWQLREHAFPAQATDRVTGETRINDQPYWKEAPGNINMEHGASSCPIDAFEFEHGFYDIIGNVWQWTETPIMPFRGFRFHPLYDDFSVPTFDTRHNIFTGGSWASTGNEATRFARYAFRRHFYQHAGFRYVIGKPLEAAPQETAMCETDPAVTHMMDAQYNDAGLATIAASVGLNHLAENYAVQFARYAVDVYKKHNHSSTTNARALDLGCATGRSTFELAKLCAASDRAAPLFEAIFGLDFSTRFIRIAAQLQFEHHAEYAFKNEGELTSYHSIESKPISAITTSSSISAPNATTIDAALARTVASTPSILDLDLESRGMQQSVEFVQGDACNLASKHRDYSLLLCSNVLEFMYDPRKFLADAYTRVRDGGLFIIASTFDWNESYTPRCNWIGGFKDATGETLKSLEGVRAILATHFNELPQLRKELPLIEKNNSRSFALKFSQITVWQRK